MNNYLILAARYLTAHTKKTRLAIISVAISVALITGVFSMGDVFLKFEKLQVMHSYGNFHLAVKDASEQEMAVIRNRIDVRNSGRWRNLGDGKINGNACRLGTLDEAFLGNMSLNILQGSYPKEKNEVMLEQWATEDLFLNVKIGHKVRISFIDNNEHEYIVSGIFSDLGPHKASGIPGVMLSPSGAEEVGNVKLDAFFVEFKEKVKIMQSVADIKEELGIGDDRLALNDHLLAVIGQSEHKAATGLYTIGGILFCLVLTAGVVMIYNTFNISVMERVRQFGLLRCVGASKSQIRRLVKKEGMTITVRAIPIGVLAGMLMTFACSAVLKFYNNTIFGEIPLFSISAGGIGAGIVIGFLTVSVASYLPAKKAAQVSPVNAVTGSNELKISKSEKKGFLSKLLQVEIAMGINSAFIKRRTLLLMACSIALSIIMFLGFNVLIDFTHASLKTTKPYSPDISLVSEQGISDEILLKMSEAEGIRNVYGRRLAYVNAAFDAARLSESYKKEVRGIKVDDKGLLVPPEKSWLISYETNQFRWAKRDLLEGVLSEDKLNEGNGVIAVARNLRQNITKETASLKLGDKIYIDTPKGKKELTVMGILKGVPFNSSELTLTSFVTTEKIFTEITGEADYKVLDIQLKKKNDEKTVELIKGSLDNNTKFLDIRQKNSEMNQLFYTMAVFVYGFVAVIALISILNIVNTMNTSVAAKTRYLGVMRAIGMSGTQLSRMVLVEAATYSITGCISGSVLGVLLQKALIENFLTSTKVKWEFPTVQLILIAAMVAAVTVFSVIKPLKRIKAKGVSEVVNSL